MLYFFDVRLLKHVRPMVDICLILNYSHTSSCVPIDDSRSFQNVDCLIILWMGSLKTIGKESLRYIRF